MNISDELLVGDRLSNSINNGNDEGNRDEREKRLLATRTDNTIITTSAPSANSKVAPKLGPIHRGVVRVIRVR